MSQTVKLRRSATPNTPPGTSALALGELAINTYDGKLYLKKNVSGTETIVEIGANNLADVFKVYEYPVTTNRTVFSGADGNTNTLSYTTGSPPKVAVFLNGLLLDWGLDFTGTNGTSIVLASAAVSGDLVQIQAYKSEVAISGNLQFDDNVKALFGNDGDLEIYHDSNKSIINDNGTGNLQFQIGGSAIYDVTTDGIVLNNLDVEASEFIGDLRGSVLFKAQAGEALTKGQVVTITGISGNTTVVSKADANVASLMPAFGVVAASASANNPVNIYTFGIMSNLTTNLTGWTIGDSLYVSTTPGVMTNVAPTGSGSQIQKIAKITKIHASTGSIDITGAGRSNATPNLDEGRLFVGNSSNQSVQGDDTLTVDMANSQINVAGNITLTGTVDGRDVATDGSKLDTIETSATADQTLAEINALGITATGLSGTPNIGVGTISSGNITTTGYLRGPANFVIDPAAHGANSGTVVIAGDLQIDGTTTTINSTTLTVDDKNITLAGGSANAAAANGAGLTVAGANATLTYTSANDEWNFNKNLVVGGKETTASFPLMVKSNTDHKGLHIEENSGAESWQMGVNVTGDLNFYNSGSATPSITFEDSGNVGIGTTAPYYKLDTRFSNTNTTLSGGGSGEWGSNGIRIDNTNATVGTMALAHFRVGDADWHIGSKRVGTDQADFIFANEGATKMLIDHTGNVGIGVTNPSSAKLQVDRASGTTLYVSNSNPSATGDIVHIRDNEGATGTNSFGGIKFSSSPGHDPHIGKRNAGSTGYFAITNSTPQEVFTIDLAVGNVGIGTTTPTEKLVVNGSLNSSNQSANFSTGPYRAIVDIINATKLARIGTVAGTNTPTGTQGEVSLIVNSSEKVRIKASGNVGIGNNDPKAKLQVEEYGIDTTETSTSATTQVVIHTMPSAVFRSARFSIQVSNSTDSTYHISEILMIHDGTTPQITEYGKIFTANEEATFDADISGGLVRLFATPATADSMEFKVVAHSITV